MKPKRALEQITDEEFRRYYHNTKLAVAALYAASLFVAAVGLQQMLTYGINSPGTVMEGGAAALAGTGKYFDIGLTERLLAYFNRPSS